MGNPLISPKICWIATRCSFNDCQAEQISREGIQTVFPKHNPSCFLSKIIRRLSVLTNIRVSYWSVDSHFDISSFDIIIVKKHPLLLKYINGNLGIIKNSAKIIVWDENACKGDTYDFCGGSDKRMLFFSFDKRDSTRFHLHYINSFSSVRLPALVDTSLIVENCDVIFVGSTDEYRNNKIDQCFSAIKKLGFSCKKVIIPNRMSIPYQKYLAYFLSGKVILDITREYQFSPTLRPLEGMFLGRKVLTDCVETINQPYFRESNIFLVQSLMKDPKSFIAFINKPLVAIPQSDWCDFDTKGWVAKLIREITINE